MSKILEHFEFESDRRLRRKQEKEKRQRQEEEAARQEAEFFKEKECLEELSKSKSKDLSEEYGIPDYTP